MEPKRWQARLQALDRLDRWRPLAPGAYDQDGQLARRVRVLLERIEAANAIHYAELRKEIQQGRVPKIFAQGSAARRPTGIDPKNVPAYDALDELVSGVLGFDPPDDCAIRPAPEKVLYQPTPARLIFDLLEQTALASRRCAC